MKIEIDLKDILQDDDYGSETLQESIKRQVISNIQSKVSQGIEKKIDIEISGAIEEQIKKALEEIRPNLIMEIMDAEYVAVDRYGDRSKEPTTFRKQLIKSIHENMVYKNTQYDSERNNFTRAVNDVLTSQIKGFKTQFDEIINKEYVEQTKAYAIKVLKEKLGI